MQALLPSALPFFLSYNYLVVQVKILLEGSRVVLLEKGLNPCTDTDTFGAYFGAAVARTCSDHVLMMSHKVPNTLHWTRHIFSFSYVI